MVLFLIGFFFSCSSKPKIEVKVSSTPPPQEKNTPQDSENLPPVVQEQEEITTLNEETDVSEPPSNSLLEEAFISYQDAQTAWEKGDFETALTALDAAYGLLLKLEIPPDSPLFQDKNDLRLLIAQRIQEIYASRLGAVGENHQTIPLVENKYVLAEIKNFQTKEQKSFLEAYQRSGLYREMILDELKKAGLPEELSWLPVIESWFKVRAFSRARALGLWQFISSTGYRYGLKRDRWIDERMDPEKSTRAAVKYLNELHSFFGDWTTALAAYNCGEFKVQRVIRAQRVKYLDNFWDLYVMLPRETARFVPRFIATLLIINNPAKYGMSLPRPNPPLEYEKVSINKAVKLSTLSKSMNLDNDELAALNPELRHDGTPNYEYSLKVPPRYGTRTTAALNSLNQWVPPEASYIIHYVRRGQTLSGIADRYRTSVNSIARLNGMRRVHLIRPGQRLKIPARGVTIQTQSPPKITAQKDGKMVYSVKRGDSLYQVARMFNTTIQHIKGLNNLKSNILRVGQKLVITSEKPPNSITYKVKSGDTPYEIARKFGMNLDNLLLINGLSRRSKIYPGQELWVLDNNH